MDLYGIEAIGLSDRVLVMREGRVMAELSRDDATDIYSIDSSGSTAVTRAI